MLTALIVPVPHTQLFNVFHVIVLAGEVPPSVKLIPVIVVVPATVMLEKILFWTVEVEPVTELPLSVINNTDPLAPSLLKAVTIELLFTVFVPVAVALYVWDM